MQTPSAMLLQGTLAISHILLHACIQIENKIEIGLTQDLWVTLHLDITWKRGNLVRRNVQAETYDFHDLFFSHRSRPRSIFYHFSCLPVVQFLCATLPRDNIANFHWQEAAPFWIADLQTRKIRIPKKAPLH